MSATTSTPPGSVVLINTFTQNGSITFANKRPYTPLQPLTEVYLDANNEIQVSNVVFIDSAITGITASSFTVYQDSCISETGQPRLQFFISYDAEETETTTFNSYQISFQALPSVFPNTAIETIQSFLWDVDPTTSRGTVTRVI